MVSLGVGGGFLHLPEHFSGFFRGQALIQQWQVDFLFLVEVNLYQRVQSVKHSFQLIRQRHTDVRSADLGAGQGRAVTGGCIVLWS